MSDDTKEMVEILRASDLSIAEFHAMQIRIADTIERLERDRDALAERCEKLQDAVRAFLAKYDLLEPALNNAFLMQQIHGAPYRGDNWADELAALRALAAPKDAP